MFLSEICLIIMKNPEQIDNLTAQTLQSAITTFSFTRRKILQGKTSTTLMRSKSKLYSALIHTVNIPNCETQNLVFKLKKYLQNESNYV